MGRHLSPTTQSYFFCTSKWVLIGVWRPCTEHPAELVTGIWSDFCWGILATTAYLMWIVPNYSFSRKLNPAVGLNCSGAKSIRG